MEEMAQGIWVLAAILAASVVALAVFAERLVALRRSRVLPKTLAIQVHDLVAEGRFPDAITACRTQGGPLARIYQVALEHREKDRALVKEHLEEAGRQEAGSLMELLPVIGTVGVIAPLMGLLGTVWGMIDVFKAIQEFGVGNAEVLAGGISTALYTTLGGLLVAIPAVVGHRYLLARVDRTVLALEAEALRLLDRLESQG